MGRRAQDEEREKKSVFIVNAGRIFQLLSGRGYGFERIEAQCLIDIVLSWGDDHGINQGRVNFLCEPRFSQPPPSDLFWRIRSQTEGAVRVRRIDMKDQVNRNFLPRIDISRQDFRV
jgi:hypothetical protein